MLSFFKLAGSYLATQLVRSPTDGPDIGFPFESLLQLVRKHYDEVQLTSDLETPFAFGGVASAAVVVLRTETHKVIVKLTSADGTKQIVPVQEILILVCTSVPITAIDLVRMPGVTTNVKVFLGEQA